ncbi:hypothetical protein HN51_021358 [Arachis hypogaea]
MKRRRFTSETRNPSSAQIRGPISQKSSKIAAVSARCSPLHSLIAVALAVAHFAVVPLAVAHHYDGVVAAGRDRLVCRLRSWKVCSLLDPLLLDVECLLGTVGDSELLTTLPRRASPSSSVLDLLVPISLRGSELSLSLLFLTATCLSARLWSIHGAVTFFPPSPPENEKENITSNCIQ